VAEGCSEEFTIWRSRGELLKHVFLNVQGFAITPEGDSFREHFKHPGRCDKGFEQKMISSAAITNRKIAGPVYYFPGVLL